MSYTGDNMRININDSGRICIPNVSYDVKNAWQMVEKMYQKTVSVRELGCSFEPVVKASRGWSFLQMDSSADFIRSTQMKIIPMKSPNEAQTACCDIEQLSKMFDVDKEVYDFIRDNSFLLPLLGTIYSKIFDFFSDAKLGLEVVKDPEIQNDYQLLLSVATNLDPESAVKKLFEFDQQWWLENMYQAQGKLCLDVVPL